MTKLWPDSLRGQVIALILLGLVIAQLIGFAIYQTQHQTVLRTISEEHALNRVGAVLRLLADTPPNLHQRIVRASSSPLLRLRIGVEPTATTTLTDPRSERLRQQLAALIGIQEESIRIDVQAKPARLPRRDYKRRKDDDDDRDERRRRRWERRQAATAVLAISVQLDQSRWLNASSLRRPQNSFWQWSTLLSLALTALILSLLMILLVRRITRPLAALTNAAEQFGRGETPATLAKTGPADIRQTVAAFEKMQQRLQRFVRDRTQMLAAISHDLRTPITALRLRAELIEEVSTRDKILNTLAEMQRMTEATLAFAREDANQEETRLVDLDALIASLCDDLSDTGAVIDYHGPGKTPYRCRPVNLKRAITNVVENAVRYGQRARLELSEDADADTVLITIEDDGPGISEQEQERVFEPFVRLETSRSQDTGGVGLGLAIARSIIHAHGGDIRLSNRSEGGLRVTLQLPKPH